MKLVVFGLTVTTSWGNGHATLWRGLIRALARKGHHVVFFEKDVPYYAPHRDLTALEGCTLVLYRDFAEVRARAEAELDGADAGMVTSYCPDGQRAAELVFASRVARRLFYDLDTPVTLARLEAGERVEYLPEEGLGGFHSVLSFTGGVALERLRERLGARHTAALYGSVDPEVHHEVPPQEGYRAHLSYLGTWAADRQASLEALFIEPAREMPSRRFVLGGAQYPQDFPWTDNLWFVQHLPPSEHPAFFSSSTLTLNLTRAAMTKMGWCPSGRLFEASACGCAVLSDAWEGLETFFRPGEEILIARNKDDVVGALSLSDAELSRIRRAAQARTLASHTSEVRAQELVALIEAAGQTGMTAPASS